MADTVVPKRLVKSHDATSQSISNINNKLKMSQDEQQQHKRVKQRTNDKSATATRRQLSGNLVNAQNKGANKQNPNRSCQPKQSIKKKRQQIKKPRQSATRMTSVPPPASLCSLPGGGQFKSSGADHICYGCQKPIRDRYLLSACDKFWHDECLKCDRCHAKLGELGSTLYQRANMNLCRQDYLEMFGQKATCAVCDKLIYASEMVMRARDNVYHLECFACQLCGLRFCIGDRFHLCENKIVCQYDYDEHIYPIQESMLEPAQSDQMCSAPSASNESKLIHQQAAGSRSDRLSPEQRVRVAESSGGSSCGYANTLGMALESATFETKAKETAGEEPTPRLDQLQQPDAHGGQIELTLLGCTTNSNEFKASGAIEPAVEQSERECPERETSQMDFHGGD